MVRISGDPRRRDHPALRQGARRALQRETRRWRGGGASSKVPAMNPLAGTAPTPDQLINIPRLITAYYENRPDPAIPTQRVSFGTSGHRGSAFTSGFNEWHV